VAEAGILFTMEEKRADLRGPGKYLVAWLPAGAWAALIFALSAQPGLTFAPDAGIDLVIRKAGHVAFFAILALLTWRAVARTTTSRRPWTWALGMTVAYAVTDELHQAFVAQREASVHDVALDAVGAVIAVLALEIVGTTRRRRAQSPE